MRALPEIKLDTSILKETNGWSSRNGLWKSKMEIPDKKFWKGVYWENGKARNKLDFSNLDIIEKPGGLAYHVEGFGIHIDEEGERQQFTIAGVVDWNHSGRVAFAFGYSRNTRSEFRGWMTCLPTEKNKGKGDVFMIGTWYTDAYVITRCKRLQTKG